MRLEDDQLFDLSQLNRDLHIERDATGVLVLMAPVGGTSSARNLELARQLANWSEQDGSGIAFDSSVGFILPNGAMRSPDALDGEDSERLLLSLTEVSHEFRQGNCHVARHIQGGFASPVPAIVTEASGEALPVAGRCPACQQGRGVQSRRTQIGSRHAWFRSVSADECWSGTLGGGTRGDHHLS